MAHREDAMKRATRMAKEAGRLDLYEQFLFEIKEAEADARSTGFVDGYDAGWVQASRNSRGGGQ